jgi:hypothetical protein
MAKIKENKDLIELGKEASKIKTLKVYIPKLKNKQKTNMKTTNKTKKVAVTPNGNSFRVRKTENGQTIDRTFSKRKTAVTFRNSLYA